MEAKKQNKQLAKENKMKEEMERLQKISNMGSFANSDFALDTLF